ncbi:AraC family transcriptional regulator [Acidovorax cavernicola]|uniref:AraC family transcriptional regulator n=1 Tax=Acidovorax cavernicola TaxID=1675792 RepID=A0A9X8D741_9BURK|nr:AraC family transcriptional regulator [Acidovorax cavernicola]RIX82774.1 AraC family transcriptional regulator [Acidovorax cavernicola]
MASRSASVDAVRIRGSALPGLQAIAAESNRSFPRHMHDVFGIGVMDRGGQRSASGRGAVEAVRGDVITVNPGEVHDGVAMRGEARAWRMLHLAPELLSDDLPGFELERPVLSDPALRQGFDRLFTAVAEGDDALALEQGVLQLLRRAPGAQASESLRRVAPAAMERARARIADDCIRAPSLAELAREAGLSRYQLLRGFAAAFGLPPHAWLQQCRLSRARRLIAQGRALADAAAGAGFADQSHMTRAFVRFLGFTPGAYAMARCG